jgi:transcriptional regulator with XRE-family HTH domain
MEPQDQSETLANLLTKHINRIGMTASKLAQEAHISPSYASLLLGGHKKSPRLDVIRNLARGLKLGTSDTDELFRAAGHSYASIDATEKSLETNLVRSAGIVNVHQDLTEAMMEDRMLMAQRLIRIQDSWLSNLTFYCRIFRQILSSHNNEQGSSQERKQIPTIQILLLDYENKPEIAEMRAADLGLSRKGYIQRQVEDAVEEFRRIKEETHYKDFEVRLFQSLPSVQQLAIDDRAFIGFFVHGERSQSAAQLELIVDVEDPLNLGRRFEEEFTDVWSDKRSRTVV